MHTKFSRREARKLFLYPHSFSLLVTQQQIADLFGVKQPAISKHLKNIFESEELDEASVHSILEYTGSEDKSYRTKF